MKQRITALVFAPLHLQLEIEGEPGAQTAWRDLPALRATVGEFLLHRMDPDCRESAGHRLEELTGCRLVAGQLETGYRGGSRQHSPLAQEPWEHLLQAVQASPSPPDRRASQVVDKVTRLLEREVLEFQGSGPHMNAQIVEELAQTLTNVQNAVPDADLGSSWANHQQLRRMVAGPISSDSHRQFSLPKLELDEPGREFLLELLSTRDSLLQNALAAADPICTLCGECCRRFAVEIQPSDITRLSRHLGVSYGQFVDEYTGPGQFSWNLQSRTLNKQSFPTSSRMHIQLPVAHETDCVFLRRDQSDGLHYCRVHTHRPSICRDFEPNNQLCREVNHSAHPQRQAQNLAWIEITPAEIWVQTLRRQAARHHPLILARSRWPQLDRAAQRLWASGSIS